jgi:hypothetical protein
VTNEELLQFPCEFPIKIFGKDNDLLRQTVRSIIERHCGELDDNRVSERKSSGGRFVSITATIRVENRAQIDSIYQDLCASPHVVMSL